MLPTDNLSRLDELAAAIHHAAHLLPAQGPITAFVHHNTLHHFEEMPFEQAVLAGGELFGCHPYLAEDTYREKLAQGRIAPEDIDAVLIDDMQDRADELLGFLGTRFHLRRGMLAHPLRTGTSSELRWVVAETGALRRFRGEVPAAQRDRVVADTRRWVVGVQRGEHDSETGDARHSDWIDRNLTRFGSNSIEGWSDATWESFCLHLLWRACREGVMRADVPAIQHPLPIRHRDLLLEATGEDSDQQVHEVLIRYCAAFLDQGLSSWSLPREEGFFRTFLALHATGPPSPARWLSGLPNVVRRLQTQRTSPLESIQQSLDLLGVSEEEAAAFLTATLLALPGFAGMVWQVENRSDRVARPIPPGTLIEFVAVRLLLERLALADVARRRLKYCGALAGLRAAATAQCRFISYASVEQRAFQIFQLAELLGWEPESLYGLAQRDWSTIVREIEAFSGVERRRIYHLAYERNYREQALAAIARHNPLRGRSTTNRDQSTATKPKFQLITCLDDREESLRRHLEEVAPHCETFGAAGFFAVAMYYRGAVDAFYKPLCPVAIRPRHYVREIISPSGHLDDTRRLFHRRTMGTVTQRVHLGSRTFAGGWLAALTGSIASVPLVTRILFPRATSRLRRAVGGFVWPPAETDLHMEQSSPSSVEAAELPGFSVDDMAGIVRSLLDEIGLRERLAPLVVVCGHGSSSLNNPHESAYNCGACAGGHGGPNARAFARMANDPRVRSLLATTGLMIPTETLFVGAYHNTCDDSVVAYDRDHVPASHREQLLSALESIEQARRRNAQERGRRFRSLSLLANTETALRHVETRSEDLSQPRPEYNHATNALCLVGRRDWSRGLFLDRRAFLASYDPRLDDERHTLLTRTLQAVIPVCAGINLEYLFSTIDNEGYGCGNKLPHNIVSLLGVMTGAASDLRPGLSAQMVEIHEPMRLLVVVEATPLALDQFLHENSDIERLVRGDWIYLATFDPETSALNLFQNGQFRPYQPSDSELPGVASSAHWYRGWREHLGFASVMSPENGAKP